MNKHGSENACSCHFICTYDNVEKEIAWYNEVDGRLNFIGHGSVAPAAYMVHREDESLSDSKGTINV